MQGLRKNQHTRHHNQKTKLLFPSIISMSLIKRFPPGNKGRIQTCRQLEINALCHLCMNISLIIIFTVYVADASDLQENQNKQHPAGNKLVDESHPVYSCLLNPHKHTNWVEWLGLIQTTVSESYTKAVLPLWHMAGPGGRGWNMLLLSVNHVWIWRV